MRKPTTARIWNAWRVFLRLLVGFYWLYFSSQKWFNNAWVKPILDGAASTNPIRTVGIILRDFVIPNWQPITTSQTILEAAIGTLFLIGLFTRVSGILGTLLASTLLVTFLGSIDAPVFIWFYLLSASASLTVAISDAGKSLGLDSLLEKKWPNPRLNAW